MATALHVSADAQPECIRTLRNLVASVAYKEGLSREQVYAVKLCVNEALANAVEHGYPKDSPGSVEVDVREVGDELAVVVADQGQGQQLDIPKDHGGFGFAWITRLTNGCTFTAASSGTTVEMLFPLPRGKSEKQRSARPTIIALADYFR